MSTEWVLRHGVSGTTKDQSRKLLGSRVCPEMQGWREGSGTSPGADPRSGKEQRRKGSGSEVESVTWEAAKSKAESGWGVDFCPGSWVLSLLQSLCFFEPKALSVLLGSVCPGSSLKQWDFT